MEYFKWVNANDAENLRHQCMHLRPTKPKLVESVDKYGNTPLLRACYLGYHRAAHTLITYGGASVRAINYFGQNALTLATYSGNYDLVVELLHHRTYDDFNLSSVIPALMVAIMRQDTRLISYFRKLDMDHGEQLRTVHGLGTHDMQRIFGQSSSHHHHHHQKPQQLQHQHQCHQYEQKPLQCKHQPPQCKHQQHYACSHHHH